MRQSTGLFGRHHEEVCSVESGSCENCMSLDIKRLGLPRRYLLNFQGRVCCFVPESKIIFCGVSAGARRCNNEMQCQYCKQTLELVKRGFYKTFLM